MRAVLFIIIVGVLVIIAGVATGFISVSKIRSGEVPQVTASRNGIVAKGGRPPSFDVETGSVKVGAAQTTMNMPTLRIQKANQKSATDNSGNRM